MFEARDIPVLLCELWPDKASAQACVRGTIHLMFCPNCGLIENKAFDSSRVHYSDAYENSLEGSALFRSYQEQLAHEVVERHGLRQQRVMEVGCGNGAFLERICKAGDNEGIGFDPSYPDNLPTKRLDGKMLIVREYFGPEHAGKQADAVISRQVLEHIPNPRPFLKETLAPGLRKSAQASLIIEVPNTEYTLANIALWEITYEHCTYFSRGSLARLLASCGFDVTHSETSYSDQFITLDARISEEPTGSILAPVEDLSQLAELSSAFAREYADRITDWQAQLQTWSAKGQRIALWGSGTRGISFLNLADPTCTIDQVIDVNPRKHGKYVPGTGQRIDGPGQLQIEGNAPDIVLIVNPVYVDEITQDLHGRDLHPEILTL